MSCYNADPSHLKKIGTNYLSISSTLLKKHKSKSSNGSVTNLDITKISIGFEVQGP